MGVSFKRARKAESKLRMALAGPSGSGKTYSALAIATGLADGGAIAVIDTERGSASKYADQFAFDVLELDSFHPDRYIEAIQAAAAAGYAVLIIDSLTHAWKGVGGLLEVHEQIVKRQKTPNSYTAWAEVTPIQNRLIDAITGASLHVIATMRAKSDYVQDKNERGGTTIRKVGMAPEQRDGMEYEYDIFGQIDLDHNLIVEKSRCSALAGAVIAKPGAGVAQILAEWLHGEPGESDEMTTDAAEPRPAARPQPAPSERPPERQDAARRGAAAAWATDEGYDPISDMTLRPRVKALGITTMADFETFLAHIRDTYTVYNRKAIESEVIVREEALRKAQAKVTKAKPPAAEPVDGVDDRDISNHNLREAFPASAAHSA